MRRYLLIVLFCIRAFFAMGQLNTDRMLVIGRNALYFEDYVLSIQYFNQIIKVKPYLVEPYFYRAIAKIQLEDYAGAENDCNEVIDRNPFMPQAFYARGFVRMRLGKVIDAQEDFSKALEFSPENVIYTINRVEAYLQSEQYDKALADVDTLLRRNKNVTDLMFERGRILLLKKDTAEALQVFDNLVVNDSLNFDAWGARALVKLQLNDNSGALADYNKAIQLGARNAGYHINRGILNYQIKNYRGALTDYDKAISLEPTNETALFNRSLLRAEVGDLNNAVADLTTLIDRNPDYPSAVYQRALLFSELYDWKAAEQDFSTIIAKYPTFVPAYYGRSRVYEKMGKKRAAFDDYEKAEKLIAAAKNKQLDTVQKQLAITPNIATEESFVKVKTRLFRGTSVVTNSTTESIRGSIQNEDRTVISEKNFVLSYYQKEDLVRKGERYSPLVSVLNDTRLFSGKVKLVNREMPLNTQLINYHFKSIDELSKRVEVYQTNANLYIARGIDYALVQDFSSAIADFTRAIYYDSEHSLAYFSRANIRFKELEFKISESSNLDVNWEQRKDLEKAYAHDFEMIMRDYDRAIDLAPDFSFAWFNRGNVLSVQKDFKAAIQNYSKAIAIDNEFAEAYFNRGLTYIFVGETQKGMSDLSKAGELGMYQAYNYLKRLRD
ncbi:MAG TPA: tetratricopeptide repeat protein [Paludibacteraceae bacterium]|nr:tetratricopeptide repeat protein [Paludibacteraceae bacterium]